MTNTKGRLSKIINSKQQTKKKMLRKRLERREKQKKTRNTRQTKDLQNSTLKKRHGQKGGAIARVINTPAKFVKEGYKIINHIKPSITGVYKKTRSGQQPSIPTVMPIRFFLRLFASIAKQKPGTKTSDSMKFEDLRVNTSKTRVSGIKEMSPQEIFTELDTLFSTPVFINNGEIRSTDGENKKGIIEISYGDALIQLLVQQIEKSKDINGIYKIPIETSMGNAYNNPDVKNFLDNINRKYKTSPKGLKNSLFDIDFVKPKIVNTVPPGKKDIPIRISNRDFSYDTDTFLFDAEDEDPKAITDTDAVQPETVTGTEEEQPEAGTGTDAEQPEAEAGTGTDAEQPETEAGTGTDAEQPETEAGTGTDAEQPEAEAGTGTDAEQPETGTGTEEEQPETGTGTEEEQPEAEAGTGTEEEQPETGTGVVADTDAEQPETGTDTDAEQPEAGTGVVANADTDAEQPETGTGIEEEQPETDGNVTNRETTPIIKQTTKPQTRKITLEFTIPVDVTHSIIAQPADSTSDIKNVMSRIREDNPVDGEDQQATTGSINTSTF